MTEVIPPPIPADAHIGTILTKRVGVHRLSRGMVVGVTEAGQHRFAAHGHTDSAATRSVDADTLFEIGSITKLFTALVLTDMINEGDVAVGDPVHDLLPSGVHVPARNGRSITLGDLATHRSGLPRMPTDFGIDHWTDPGKRLPQAARLALSEIADQIEALALKFGKLEHAIVKEAKHDDDMRRLCTIPGVGAIIAASIKAMVPDPGGFKSGRHFAAWLGLTPKPHSSGGKERLGGISKMGNPTLRSLLVLGATSVLRHVKGNASAPPWLSALLARRPFKVVAIALANKMARVIWALLTKGGTYRTSGTTSEPTHA